MVSWLKILSQTRRRSRRSRVIRKGKPTNSQSDTIKGTIDEELYDVIYYCLALANIYDIDIEQAISLKEVINKERTDH
jgi:NTP pyrophosphatase (non-canonical NTP hydrolase)